ncbi:MAG: hypothetical protein AAGC72_16835, partial [Planctomycetota bacterium]
TSTAIKLPFAFAWDVATLGNMGERSSTERVLAEHQRRKFVDTLLEDGKEWKQLIDPPRNEQE